MEQTKKTAKKKRKKVVKRGLAVPDQIKRIEKSIAQKQKTIAKHEAAIRRLQRDVKRLTTAKRAREIVMERAKHDTRVLKDGDFAAVLRERRERGEIKESALDHRYAPQSVSEINSPCQHCGIGRRGHKEVA